MIDIVEIIAKLSRYRFVPLRLRHHRTKFRASVTLWFLLEVYRPRNRKGSAVRKGERGREEAETNVPERNEKREGKKGGGKKEARRVIARDCTVARIIARAPEKRHFKFVHPPWKTYFLLFVARARSDPIYWIPPIPIFRTPIFRNTCRAFTSYNISSWPWNRASSSSRISDPKLWKLWKRGRGWNFLRGNRFLFLFYQDCFSIQTI